MNYLPGEVWVDASDEGVVNDREEAHTSISEELILMDEYYCDLEYQSQCIFSLCKILW